jgi:hypothetical protein
MGALKHVSPKSLHQEQTSADAGSAVIEIAYKAGTLRKLEVRVWVLEIASYVGRRWVCALARETAANPRAPALPGVE